MTNAKDKTNTRTGLLSECDCSIVLDIFSSKDSNLSEKQPNKTDITYLTKGM